jgi:hypothetical protein
LATDLGADLGMELDQDAAKTPARNGQTGHGIARPSQIRRIEVGDLQVDRNDPRLLMPASKKGRGPKKISHRPVPIPADLALRLRQSVAGRRSDEPLLKKANGSSWSRLDHAAPFARVAGRVGLPETTLYALRHFNIVRHLLAGVPICGHARHERDDDREEL